jgi:hypothetical protein
MLALITTRRNFSNTCGQTTKLAIPVSSSRVNKHHAFGAAGPLTDEDESRRLEPTPVSGVHSLGAGDHAACGKIVT